MRKKLFEDSRQEKAIRLLLGPSRNRNAKKLFQDPRQKKAILFLLAISIPTRTIPIPTLGE